MPTSVHEHYYSSSARACTIWTRRASWLSIALKRRVRNGGKLMADVQQMIAGLPEGVPEDFFRFLHSIDLPVVRDATYLVKVMGVFEVCLIVAHGRLPL